MMNAERWKLVKSIFRLALDLPEAERETFVSAQCTDETLRQEVLNLIRHHREQSAFLQSPLENRTSPTGKQKAVLIDLTGWSIEDFTIERRIGAGGMGIVYEARQNHPPRLVAIKVVNATTSASEKELLRFEHEAEILARLQHPGIAHIYAAGWHDFGHGRQPWFAMELIDGQPSSFIANEPGLTIREKLELLLKVCDAVSHAHGRGVIHRDLKPANILISAGPETEKNGAGIGQPKIVDFGVARVMDGDRRATMQTSAGDILGTLNYMCPEQISGDPSRVDERSDVYALGVIGFEWLAGRLPFDRTGTIVEALRKIEQQLAEPLGQINSSLRGDLEVIFNKAISHDADRRYQSVTEFADDLRRFLNHEPILARPASLTYRARKFASRHRALVGGVAATMLSLIIGIVLYANEARHARQAAADFQYEAEKATAINNFITNDFLMKLLAAANQPTSEERLPTVELVDKSAETIPAMFGTRPKIEAAVRNEIGTIYYNLNFFGQAAEEFERALALWENDLGSEHPDTLKAVNNLGQSYVCVGRRDEAERLYRRAVEGRTRVLGEADSYTLASMNNLAQLLQNNRKLDEAERMFRRTLDLQQLTLGDDHKDTLITKFNLGSLLIKRNNIEGALDLHRDAYNSAQQSLGSDHILALQASFRYAQTLFRAGEFEQALAMLTPIPDSVQRISGSHHGVVISSRRLLAKIYREQGQFEKALETLNSTLDGLLDGDQHSASLVKSLQRDIDKIKFQMANQDQRD